MCHVFIKFLIYGKKLGGGNRGGPRAKRCIAKRYLQKTILVLRIHCSIDALLCRSYSQLSFDQKVLISKLKKQLPSNSNDCVVRGAGSGPPSIASSHEKRG